MLMLKMPCHICNEYDMIVVLYLIQSINLHLQHVAFHSKYWYIGLSRIFGLFLEGEGGETHFTNQLINCFVTSTDT